MVLEVNDSGEAMHSKVGGNVKVLGLDEGDAVTVRVVVNVLQLVQDGNALLALLFIIC